MTSKTQQHSIGVEIANQIIDLANTRLEAGDLVEDIASGLRHAAANFSAYAFFRSEKLPKDPNDTVENFISFFEHYLSVHKPKEEPGQGLKHLIEQAKNEI
ncbi:DUF3144 domain-containing protein [Magnetovibrio sp.]|uniref:DUF3144 domain-containing protein n=1 Tax=Magnetovibrio sp. TaxID=2024836 RepID=UPI002F929025